MPKTMDLVLLHVCTENDSPSVRASLLIPLLLHPTPLAGAFRRAAGELEGNLVNVTVAGAG